MFEQTFVRAVEVESDIACHVVPAIAEKFDLTFCVRRVQFLRFNFNLFLS